MKHKLLTLTLLLCALIVGSGTSWGQSTITFDFEDDGAHRASGTNTYGTNSYTENSIAISTTYGDVVTHSNVINGDYSFTGRVAKKTTNSPSGVIGPIDISDKTVTNIAYKIKGVNTQTLIFSTSLNNTSWTEQESYVGPTTVANKSVDVNITGTNLYLKWSATVSSSTNSNRDFILDDIVITYTPKAPAYTITAQSNNESYGTVSLSGSVITGSPKTGCRYASPAYSVSPANSATVSQDGNAFTVTPSANTTVTINFEEIPKYTVTLGDNNATLTEVSAGAGVTLPSRNALNGYEFAGWSETNVTEETTTAPTIISAGEYTPTANITLYPVYTKTVGGGGTSHETASVTVSEYATTNNWGSSSSANQKSITLNSDVTATCNSGTNSGKYYSDWRIYQNETGKVTINTTSGELTSVTFTFTNNNSGTLNYNSSAITSGTAVDVSGTSAEFTVGNSGTATNGQIRITAISVNYDVTGGGTTYYWSSPVAAAVETPSIDVAENPFLFSTTATITCATDGATIKYSYDGENWSDYSAALTITETKTIYAKAIKDNDESSVAQVTATKNLATPTVTVSGDLTLDLDGETNVTAGTLTAAVTYNQVAVANATVTWSSSDTDIATINESTGAVTIKTTGKVTFTATYAANNDYAEATGTKTVTVVDSNAPGTTQQNPYTVAQALANTPSSGTSANVYIRGIVSSFYNTDIVSDGNNYRYYISDDGTTTNQLLVYKGKKNSSDNFSSADDLEVGDVVIIYGGLTTYQNAPEIASGNYIVSRTTKAESDLTKTSDITLDYKNNATDADLTEYFTTSSNGAITYTIADETVIERADELISALKVGTTTVTVSQAATQIYKAGEIVIYITVQDTREAATTIPAINISTLKVGDSGTLSVTSPVKADDGVTFSYASSDNDVLLIVDDEYEAIAIGTATVSVTATPSNANLYKPVVANFEVIVETDVKTDTEITLDKESGSTIYGTAKSVDYLITDGYNGTMSYTIDKAAIADVEIGATAITFTPKAVGTAVITFGAPETATFNAAEDVQYTLTVTAPDGGTEAALGPEVLFNETFDECDGSGGRDGTYTGNVGTSATTDKLDETWTSIGSNGASQCIKLGTGSASGAVTTSDISLTGNGTLTFSAAGWGDTKTNTITVTATGANISGETEVTLEASTWNDYTVNITEATGAVAITFTMKRGFLDDVKVTTEGVEITATLNASGYATYCSEYPLDFTSTKGYTAWDLKAIDGNNTMTFERISGKIKGGQGILLKGTANETINLTSANSTDVLEGTKFVGIMVPTYVTKGSYYGLSGDKFKKAANNGVVPAGKAIIYHELINEELQNNEPITVSKFVFVDETTGITTIEEVNREVVEGIFDLQGRRLAQPQKGINIINGKKVVIK